VRGEREESRQGSRGKTLEGMKPKRAAGGRCAKHMLGRKGLSEGSKPGSRGSSERLATQVMKRPARETARGFTDGGNVGGTFREGNAPKGAIPRALSARNKAGADLEGVSRQEGNETLKAERSGCWKARGKWTSGS